MSKVNKKKYWQNCINPHSYCRNYLRLIRVKEEAGKIVLRNEKVPAVY